MHLRLDRSPFQLGAHYSSVFASIGICLFPRSELGIAHPCNRAVRKLSKRRLGCSGSGVLLCMATLETFPTKPPSRLRSVYKLTRNFQWSDIVAGNLQTGKVYIYIIHFWQDVPGCGVSHRIHGTEVWYIYLHEWMKIMVNVVVSHGKLKFIVWNVW